MTITLYELVGVDAARPFSPHCWKVAFALAHKGLDFTTVPVPFTQIGAIEGGATKTVPLIRDGETLVGDSFAIALHLEEAYPDRPSLFGGEGGVVLSRFIEKWANATLVPFVGASLLPEIHAALEEDDQAYFRQTREARFGGALEDVARGREERLEAFRNALVPLRAVVKRQPFLGGEGPLFADYIVAGVFQWARVISPFPFIVEDDPVAHWFERCLELHDGLGRRVPAA